MLFIKKVKLAGVSFSEFVDIFQTLLIPKFLRKLLSFILQSRLNIEQNNQWRIVDSEYRTRDDDNDDNEKIQYLN